MACLEIRDCCLSSRTHAGRQQSLSVGWGASFSRTVCMPRIFIVVEVGTQVCGVWSGAPVPSRVRQVETVGTGGRYICTGVSRQLYRYTFDYLRAVFPLSSRSFHRRSAVSARQLVPSTRVLPQGQPRPGTGSRRLRRLVTMSATAVRVSPRSYPREPSSRPVGPSARRSGHKMMMWPSQPASPGCHHPL